MKYPKPFESFKYHRKNATHSHRPQPPSIHRHLNQIILIVDTDPQVLFVSVQQMGKRGIRQRLDLDSQPSSLGVPTDPENTPKRGGIKKRVETSPAQPSILPAAKGGIKRRLEKTGATAETDHALEDAPKPFNKTMRQDWSRGKLSAKQVLKYCSDAAAQGAHGLGRLADHTTLQNAHRDLTRA